MSTIMPTTFVLPQELTIYTAGETRAQWLSWLSAPGDAANVDASAVEQVDGAGLQLLVSLRRSFDEQHRTLTLQQPSALLRDACKALGLEGLLAPRDATGDAA
jgi:ABC-type transporter Mla MlaB component